MNRAKTGGRRAGTPNRRTQEIESSLSSMGCDPIEGMAEIARLAREIDDLRLAGQMYKELAQYVAPKRRSIEVIAKQPTNPVEQMTAEELEDAVLEMDVTHSGKTTTVSLSVVKGSGGIARLEAEFAVLEFVAPFAAHAENHLVHFVMVPVVGFARRDLRAVDGDVGQVRRLAPIDGEAHELVGTQHALPSDQQAVASR